ncbi:MAG: hypothetical protein KF873_18620 [Gemmataceae bacterium]|nr:hypothetical protein [Gemmataceae bacterium]
MSAPSAPRPRLSLECLEGRETPAAGDWLAEAFTARAANGLPTGWSQWSTDGSSFFQVDAAGAGLGDAGRLVSSGRSNVGGHAWLAQEYAADIEVSAAVLLTSVAPVHLFVRGQNLGGIAPTYYAASAVRGGEVQLLRVVNGQSTVLATVKSVEWVSGQWVTLTVRAEGDALRVTVHRGDTNQYLGEDGKWSRNVVFAIDARDGAIRAGGRVGFSRAAFTADSISLDNLKIGPAVSAVVPRTILLEERFETTPVGAIPTSWGQTTTAAAGTFKIGVETDATLRITTPSNAVARIWPNRAYPPDVQASSSLYIDSLNPITVAARGVSLHGTAPSYYGVTITRGLDVALVAVVNGRETVLGTVKSKEYVSGLWVQVSIIAKGAELRAQIFRSDSGQYLNTDGTWSLAPAWAIAKTDTSIVAGERIGLVRGAGPAGTIIVDNVLATAAPASLARPEPIPTGLDKTGTPVVRPPEDTAPMPTPPAPAPLPPVATNPALPVVPRHYPHIRVANLAYHGTPFGTFENNLLRNSIDLVVPNSIYLSQIEAVAPNTPQFVYTNASNIYLGLYTDWLDYADRNRYGRESAFYHVTKPTPFIGLSASSVPVDRFWGFYRGTDASWQNITSNAQQASTTFRLGDVNQSVAIGHPERFRELNIDLQTAAGSGWRGTYEYVSAVDANGRPTRWSTLATITDTTAGMARDGQVTFDPPRDWVPASLNGTAKLYYLRIRTSAAGTAPLVNTITGRDYTNFLGAQRGGVIPAFDRTADTDGDGYLNDREWAARRTGFNARFVHESRLFYPTYGPNRFATNVGNAAFQAWAVDYHVRAIKAQPLADGFFVDNSVGKIDVDPAILQESIATYANDYGTLLGNINRRLGTGKWLIANTAGAGTAGEPIARAGVSTLEEFALRPVSANHVQLDDLAAMLAYRRQLSGGTAYEILDSLPQGMDATNPRVQLATLAMYYMVADPNLTMMMINGGNEPNTSWTRHWIEAIKFNVGRPTGAMRVIAEGLDPNNRALTYKVYRRDYGNAIVLYKPLSYTRGVNGTTADATATTHVLDGWYRPVNADGTLGAPINRITLRNGEGAVLARVA